MCILFPRRCPLSRTAPSPPPRASPRSDPRRRGHGQAAGGGGGGWQGPRGLARVLGRCGHGLTHDAQGARVLGSWARAALESELQSCSRELTVSENCGWGLHCAQRRCIVAHVWCACLPGVLARSHTLAAAHAPPCPSPHPPLRSLGLTTGWSAATRCPSCRTCRWGLWAPGGGLGHASQPTRRQAAARAAQRTRLYYSRQLVLAGSLQ